jgi:hypothetical protein
MIRNLLITQPSLFKLMSDLSAESSEIKAAVTLDKPKHRQTSLAMNQMSVRNAHTDYLLCLLSGEEFCELIENKGITYDAVLNEI